MKPIDKFGNTIYPKPFSKMEKYGHILESLGYVESKKNPNFFSKSTSQITVHADMRGTKYVKIWEDPRPLFRCYFNQTIPDWQRTRILKQESKNLIKAGCPCGLLDGCHYSYDGYCKICEKDFQNDGPYCSEECARKDKIKNTLKSLDKSSRCEVCRKYIISDDEWKNISIYCPEKLNIVTKKIAHEHHINYQNDNTTIVCASCHPKIHKGKVRDDLKPRDKRPERISKLAVKTCSVCKIQYKPRHKNQTLCPKCKAEELNKIAEAKREQKTRIPEDWVTKAYE